VSEVTVRRSLTALATAGADLVCPERCAACAAIVAAGPLFCHACHAAVNLLGAPECARCGTPGRAPCCARCAAGAPLPIRSARAWAAYRGDDASPVAAALALFKYGRARRLGRRMAALMAARVASRATLVVPVPLHPRRLRARGFNQSAVLARHVGRMLTLPVALRVLKRRRDTPSQTALSAVDRARNVAGAFVCGDDVRAAAVLLVDDVWTSGATARAAAHALHRAGADSVDVLTFARVL
jgi:ComF family protein